MKPNFIIVGAAKSGTTSLYHYLRQHPDVFMPEWKEPCFFIGPLSGKPIHRVKSLKEYEKLFAKAKPENAIGEATSSYLFDPDAADNIKALLGVIKILIILRNPVDMSYSLYNHSWHKEGETLKTFEEALNAEEARRNDHAFHRKCYGSQINYFYFQYGLYFKYVKKYIDTFGADNVKILIFEDFIKNPVKYTQDVYEFLGVKNTFVPVIKIHNKGGKMLIIPPFYRDYPSFKKTIRFVLSFNLLRKFPFLLRNLFQKNAPPPPLPKTIKLLQKKYLVDICNLEQLLCIDLSIWKQ